jgi:hypothetical protein
LCGLVVAALSISAATAERRVALVVGNAHYKNASLLLNNPKNDADDVGAVLRTLGFETVVVVDASKRDLDLAMTQFARLATNADTALFYYAGHALQYQGRNYLMPTDAELEDEISLRYQTTSLEEVRAAVERAGGVKIMILDACRNNPIVDSLKRKMVGLTRNVDLTRGLARVDKAQGTVVAYATAADEVASDGPGRNSPFTLALLKRLQEPGLEIGKMFRRIAADVNEMTHGQQRPEVYVSLIDEYFLNQKDLTVWDQIKDSDNPAAFRDFVTNFPSSPRVSDAQYRLALLERFTRERQAEKERAEQEAIRARLAAVEKERAEAAKLAALERERADREARERADRAEREAAQRRQADEAAKLAALERERADRERVEREAAQRRQVEEAARLAALERERANREARERTEREAAQRRQAEEAAKLAALEQGKLERERAEREAAARRREEEQRVNAEIERQKQTRLTVEPAPQPLPQPMTLPPLSQEQACKRDEERLVKLRASPAPEEIVRFERELQCTKLRPQIVRLRESIGPVEERPERSAVQQPEPPRAQPEPPHLQIGPNPPTTPETPRGAREAAAPPAPSPLPPDQVCKRDEERLARLRANPAPEEIARFERELGCARLRPQVVRLRESVGAN